MTSEAQTSEGRFIKVSWGFQDLLPASRVFFSAPRRSWRRGGPDPG
jgi:hypothetical protein